MASSSSSSATPKLVIPEEKSSTTKGTSRSSPVASSLPPTIINPPSSGTTTKKLTKILSTQTSFDRYHHPSHPVAKRFSIDADPSSIILNTPISDFSNYPSQSQQQQQQHSSTPDNEESSSTSSISSSQIGGKDPSPIRSPSLKQSDSFLEIPYEKGEIVDLIKLADDPNAETHLTNDGQEVLLEHGAVPQ